MEKGKQTFSGGEKEKKNEPPPLAHATLFISLGIQPAGLAAAGELGNLPCFTSCGRGMEGEK